MTTIVWPNSTVWAAGEAYFSAHTVDIIQPDGSHTNPKPAIQGIASLLLFQWYDFVVIVGDQSNIWQNLAKRLTSDLQDWDNCTPDSWCNSLVG